MIKMKVRYPKNSDQPLSEHFTTKEFDCNCGKCSETIIDTDFLIKLEKMREVKGSSLRINNGGGYRCANKQQQLRLAGYETATGISQHELGNAADVSDGKTPGAELEKLARSVGIKAVGVGKMWVHIDGRDDMDRRWFYKA